MAGRVEADASEPGRFWTFEAVQERLIVAMLLWRRAPDRERGWQTVRAFWPEMRRHNHFGDYSDEEATPRPLPLTRSEVAEMNAVGEWLAFVPERDRRLVALAITRLANGAAQVPWMGLRRAMGVKLGAGGLRQRYSRAITAIANRLNRAENQAGMLSSPVMCDR